MNYKNRLKDFQIYKEPNPNKFIVAENGFFEYPNRNPKITFMYRSRKNLSMKGYYFSSATRAKPYFYFIIRRFE